MEVHTGRLDSWKSKNAQSGNSSSLKHTQLLMQYCYIGSGRCFFWQIIQSSALSWAEEELTSREAGSFFPKPLSHVILEPCSELSQEMSEDPFLLSVVVFHAPCTQSCTEEHWWPSLGPSCTIHSKTGGCHVHLFQWDLTHYWSA